MTDRVDTRRKWYCLLDGQELGPLTSRQIRDMAQGGSLQRETPIRKRSSSQWHSAKEIRGLEFGTTSLGPDAKTLIVAVATGLFCAFIAFVLFNSGLRREGRVVTNYAPSGEITSVEGSGTLKLFGVTLLHSSDPRSFDLQSRIIGFTLLGVVTLTCGGGAFTAMYRRSRPRAPGRP